MAAPGTNSVLETALASIGDAVIVTDENGRVGFLNPVAEALIGWSIAEATGYGQADDRERARAAGFDDHLVKPVELSALERALAGLRAGLD
jgi:PAS domain-containing protein